MKTLFIRFNLALAILYPLALLAATFGMFPVRLVSFQLFLAIYTAAGILAVICSDYTAKERYSSRPARRARPATPVALPQRTGEKTPAWIHDTISA